LRTGGTEYWHYISFITIIIIIIYCYQAVLDAGCQRRLRDLGEHLLAAQSTTAEFSVLWRNDDGISARLHRDYLDELAWTAGTWLQVSETSTGRRRWSRATGAQQGWQVSAICHISLF